LITVAAAPAGKWLVVNKVFKENCRFLPPLPEVARRRFLSPRQPWTEEPPAIPDELLTVPGIWRDPEGEVEAFDKAALPYFPEVHPDVMRWSKQGHWRASLAVAPRVARAHRRARTAGERIPTVEPALVERESEALTQELRAYAASLGMGAIGVARHDPKYTFAPFQDKAVGDRVIVCLLELKWPMTQTAPSSGAEQTSLSTYGELFEMTAELSNFLVDKGYRAVPHDANGRGVTIHYGVEAGLGQLGLNGQLLTPWVGSRCRIALIDTNAPLVFGKPVDYGVHTICDSCKACVQRCPSGAIPHSRTTYRGVTKAKINTARCWPVVAQANGCSVCMKVCPIQRYGLTNVIDEFKRSGKVLGKGTDELEGYDWPLDGLRYGPGERPKLSKKFFNPPGIEMDFGRTSPFPKRQARLITEGDGDAGDSASGARNGDSVTVREPNATR
jgi:epoxyqueuosine reductase